MLSEEKQFVLISVAASQVCFRVDAAQMLLPCWEEGFSFSPKLPYNCNQQFYLVITLKSKLKNNIFTLHNSLYKISFIYCSYQQAICCMNGHTSGEAVMN